MAAARGQISAIQRQHRVQRRHGEEPSQTPTMSALLRQQQPEASDDSFVSSARDEECAVGDDDDDSQAPSSSQLPRLGRVPRRRSSPSRSSSQSRGRPRGRPRLSRPGLSRASTIGRPPHARNPIGRPSRPSRDCETPLRDFDEPGPHFSGDDQESPLSPEDVAIKREFDEALGAEEMKRCPRCKERWFDIKLMADGQVSGASSLAPIMNSSSITLRDKQLIDRLSSGRDRKIARSEREEGSAP
jgi:hypothetical protein